MEKSLWSIEGVPIKVTWDEWFDQTLSKWSDSMRNEWIEVKWSEMKWNEWFDGNDLEQPYGNGPMSRLRVSLWKWLDVSDLIKPYQNDQNRWEMNELKWIEWIEVKWVIWWNWLGTTLWKSPYESVESVPMEVTWVKVKMNVPIKMNGIDEIWMNWSE